MKAATMMYDVMGYSMGWPHLLGTVVVLLVIAALVKYVFFDNR